MTYSQSTIKKFRGNIYPEVKSSIRLAILSPQPDILTSQTSPEDVKRSSARKCQFKIVYHRGYKYSISRNILSRAGAGVGGSVFKDDISVYFYYGFSSSWPNRVLIWRLSNFKSGSYFYDM